MDVGTLFRLGGAAAGTLGGALVGIEFFQLPDYVEYEQDLEAYRIDTMPNEAGEYTAFGRVGAFLLALGFALLFVGNLVG